MQDYDMLTRGGAVSYTRPVLQKNSGFLNVLLNRKVCFLAVTVMVICIGTVPAAADGEFWFPGNTSAEFPPVFGHTSVVFNEKMWIIGGISGGYNNQTWYSGDGRVWYLANASAGFPARSFHTSVVFGNKMWVIGGESAGDYTNDTWYSSDGNVWYLANASAAFSPRRWHTSVVFENRIWVIGGYDKQGHYLNDIWSSADGAMWYPANLTPAFDQKAQPASVVYNNKIWLLGGTLGTGNETWYSGDGEFWYQANNSAAFPPRWGHRAVVFNNTMWITGGAYDTDVYNDVWYSGDGKMWYPANRSAEFSTRNDHTFVVFKNRMWVIAGSGAGSDTWYSPATGGSMIGVFRPSTHLFYEDYNGNGEWNGAVIDKSFNFGITGDIPVTGDWDGNGITEIGVFRPSTHLFYEDYNGNGVWNGALTDKSSSFGITGDIPVTGDWDGNGITEIGVFRPSTHLFYEDYNGNGVWNGPTTDRSYNFGISGDIPVTGDWDGNGITEIGVFRPATHLYYRDLNGNGAWNGGVTDQMSSFGITTDIPVSGDWNADGRTEIGVFRPSTHLFYEDYNGNGLWNGAGTDRSFNFGINGDSPVTGKWS